MTHPLSCLTFLLLTPALAAQVLPGDLAMTTFSTDAFGVASAAVTSNYTTPGFGGSGAATSQSILHDPGAPNDFLIGGIGFVGRATITGTGSVTYSLLNTTVGSASQMSWDANGNVIIADSGSNQVRLMTPSGVIVDLSTGTQPWGTTLNSGTYEPATGDVIVGNDGGLYRLANGSSTGTAIATGLGGSVTAVQIDRCTGDILALVLTANRLVRVTPGGSVTDAIPPSTVPGGNALQVDENGNYLIGASFGEVYRVTYDGTATLAATNSNPIPLPINGLAYVAGSGFGNPFGTACSGPNGPTWLAVDGDYTVGGTVTTTSSNHTPNALGLIVLALSTTPAPIDLGPVLGAPGCLLYANLDVVLGSATNGTGELSFSFASNATFVGQQLFCQHSVLQGALLSDLTTSNALCVQF